jgi:hypothetical protein
MMGDLFSAPVIADEFAAFWERYPRKVGKGHARKAYAKALRQVSHDGIMYGLSVQITGMTAKDKQYIPHPATWLNREGWDDESEELTSGPTGKAQNQGGSGRFDEARQRAIRAAGRGPERGFDLY